MRTLSSLILCVAALGCGKAEPPLPDGGTATFKFDVSQMVRNGMMPRPPSGSAYGDIYLQEDVSISGPRSGAMGFQGMTVDGLDLTNGISTKAVTSNMLPAGKYVWLGFLDTNSNGSTSMSPDTGDLVTLPTTNQFEIKDGQTTDRVIIFDLVYN